MDSILDLEINPFLFSGLHCMKYVFTIENGSEYCVAVALCLVH